MSTSLGPDPAQSAPLESRALFLYALPAAPVQFVYMLFLMMYLKYASDGLGATPAVVSTIFFVARVWDGISDPIVGNLSDRTTLSLGRRKSWMLGCALPFCFFSVMAWVPPDGLSATALTAWIAVSVIGFYTAYTGFEVPHLALGAEITLDPRERNRVYGARQFSRAFAMMLSAAGVQILMGEGAERETAFLLAGGAGALAVVALVYAAFALPPERPDFTGRGGESPIRAVLDVARNPHARLLLFVYFIEQLGTGAIAVLIPFILEYVILMPELTGIMLGYTFVLAILSIPLWVRLARRYEKRHLWLFAMVASGLGFGALLFLDEGTWPLIALSSTVVGLCQSCGNVLGQAIKAEIVDYDEYLTGERKEGTYFAAWTFASKLAAGIMVATVGWVLTLAGYVPNVEQTDAVKLAIVVLVGAVPLAGFSIGAVAFYRFGLSESLHARIRAELDARARGGS